MNWLKRWYAHYEHEFCFRIKDARPSDVPNTAYLSKFITRDTHPMWQGRSTRLLKSVYEDPAC